MDVFGGGSALALGAEGRRGPGLKDGRPVTVGAYISVNFQLCQMPHPLAYARGSESASEPRP